MVATVAMAPQELTSGPWPLGLDSLLLSEILTLSAQDNPALYSLVQDRKCIEICGWKLCVLVTVNQNIDTCSQIIMISLSFSSSDNFMRIQKVNAIIVGQKMQSHSVCS